MSGKMKQYIQDIHDRLTSKVYRAQACLSDGNLLYYVLNTFNCQ